MQKLAFSDIKNIDDLWKFNIVIIIDKNKTLKENNIHDGEIILINYN